ncbi:hypothetical protein LTR85_006190 [Meristemomyces frigidus]|nr:hypothetical protein LTR85_006190 [Meristemomyces frigidus]
MAPFTIEPCTAEDGPNVARNNMIAFWTDPAWVLMWKGRTLDYVIQQASLRGPKNLLTDRARRRHQKAVDSKSGAIIGYARWVLPNAACPEHYWSAARVPEVTEEQQNDAETKYNHANWSFDRTLDELDDEILKVKERLLEGRDYLRKWCLRILVPESSYGAR